MGRCIDVVTAAELISERLGIELGDLVDIFGDIPTVDVEKKTTARWVLRPESGMTRTRGTVYTCTACGARSLAGGSEKYCSECGAHIHRGDDRQ